MKYKRRITSSTKGGADSAREGRPIDIKGKPRYDVGRSDRVVRDDTLVQTICLKHLFLINVEYFYRINFNKSPSRK